MNFQVQTGQRPLVKQEWNTFSMTVPVAPAAPINAQYGIVAMVDMFIITVPSTAANSVFIGADQGVTTVTGLEILAGTQLMFRIDHDTRQLYELQAPLVGMATKIECAYSQPEVIPFIVWDLTSTYLVAAAATVISVAVFKAMHV